ncbi:MAG: hypothetical protein ACOY3I_09690 [Verrucomicrobiota bacterium]
MLRAFVVMFLSLVAIGLATAKTTSPLRLKDVQVASNYPWKNNIVTTCFWVGEGASGYNRMTNYKSAWDEAWTRNFGGVDCPIKRVKVATAGKTTLPKKFAPTLNPFYVALPFNDVKYPGLAKKYVPWWDQKAWEKDPLKSQCKGRWIMIEHHGRVAFAQWEDVGPFRYDHAKYVFGKDRPRIHSGAGLDISPALRDYLGMQGLDKANWRFVEADEVPYGPWIEYGEQAILYSAIKDEHRRKKNGRG